MTNKLIEAADELRDLVQEQFEDGCEICQGDCSSANPPMTSCPMSRRHAALTAYRAARESAVEVEVKPLVWEVFDAETAWAHSALGTYRYDAPKLTLSTQKSYVGDGAGNWRMDSLKDAKAAAQADYARRIRSALAGG